MNKKILLSFVITALSVFQFFRYQNLIAEMEKSKPLMKTFENECDKVKMDYREIVELEGEMESRFGGWEKGCDVVQVHKDGGDECVIFAIRRRGGLEALFDIAAYMQSKGMGFKTVSLKKRKTSEDYDLDIVVEVVLDERL